MTEHKRITILDGFRVIAIFIVLVYHFYDRFNGDKYEYDFPTGAFAFGALGVQFFFIISGFVITLTLSKCSSFVEFMKKRFLRLIPAMLICSSMTYFILTIFGNNTLFPASQEFSNLILSNTFISPMLINMIFSTNFAYIDGAYWSLWVELTFYIVISSLYFCDKKNILRNYSIFTLCSLLFYYLVITSAGKAILISFFGEIVYMTILGATQIFSLLRFSTYFLLGIILYELNITKGRNYLLFFTLIFILQIVLTPITVANLLFMAFIYGLLILFIYKPDLLSFLGNRFFSKLGLISYSVYLIHQNIGVLIINKFSIYLGNSNWLIGILLIFLFFLFGVGSYKYLETPISKYLKKLMFR